MSHLAIGHLYTALHAACASAVARVVEANGVDVSYVDLSEEEREEALLNQEIDILVSAWMPNDKFLLHSGREVIGDLYQPSLALFVLKKYFQCQDSHNIYTSIIVTENSLSHVKKMINDNSELKNITIENINESNVISRLKEAEEGKENPLVAIWQPHAIFHTDLLQAIPNGDIVKGEELKAQIILRDGLRSLVDDDLLDEMSIMMVGTRVMNALDYAVSIEGKDPEDAAEAWQRGRLLPR